MVGGLRDLIRTKSGSQAAREFVAGKRGLRSLLNVTTSERVRTELYRLERQGVNVARQQVKTALRSA